MEHQTTQVHNVSSDELINKIDKNITKRLSEMEERLGRKKPSEYLTRKEVASLLGVSLVTLHDWCNKNILKAYRIGNRVRFRRDEIEETLEASVTA